MSNRADAKLYELIGVLKADQGDYEGSIETFTAGIEAYPRDARLYRHRGHRFMNVRRLREAKADFLSALEFLPDFPYAYETAKVQVVPQLEQILLHGAAPDSQPDVGALKQRGAYFASLAFKIHYHLGLTQHILGEDEAAAASFELALTHSETVDLQSATLNWLVVVHSVLGNDTRVEQLLRELNFEQAAGVNGAYQEMLKVYKGLMSIDDLLTASQTDSRILATSGYGVALLLETRGEVAEARSLLERVVAEGDRHAFGTVAAEMRLREAKSAA